MNALLSLCLDHVCLQYVYIKSTHVCFYVFQNGESALHAASLFGHLKVVKQLVTAGADVHLQNKVQYCHYANYKLTHCKD